MATIPVDDRYERQSLVSRHNIPSSLNRHHSSIDSLNHPNLLNRQPKKKCCNKQCVSYFTVLLTELLERVAFYSIASNLALFLNTYPYRWESYNAASANFFFMGVSYLMCVFSGWLADSFLGKFKTIIIGFLVYISSYILLVILAPDKVPYTPSICAKMNGSDAYKNTTDTRYYVDIIHHMRLQKITHLFDEKCSAVVFIILAVIAIGVGFVKTNLTPFGGDQTRSLLSKDRRRFFNWFYWCTNIGTFIAYGPIAFAQQEHWFRFGYWAGFGCVCLALVTFLSGCTCYVKKPSGGSTFANVFNVFVSSIRTRRNIPKGFVFLQGNSQKPSCLDYAKLKYGGQFRDYVVDDVKMLLKIACIFLAMIPYWLVYFQMQTTFLIQGLHMRLSFWDHSIAKIHTPVIVVAWLQLGDPILLIILIPVMDRLVYPFLDRHGSRFGMLKRISFGMIFTCAAMLVAGGVETCRLQVFWPNSSDPFHNASFDQKIGNDTYQAANMSVFIQIPQYILLGISEIFTSIAGLEFAYSKAPKSMKGLIMGMFFFCSGAGSLLGIPTLSIFDGRWFFGMDHGNINCRIPCPDKKSVCHYCHLDYYFYSLAVFQFVFLIIFVILARVLKFTDEYAKTPVRKTENDPKTLTYNTFDNNAND